MDEKKAKDAPGEDASDLREIALVWGPFEADLIKNFLESHGLPCLVRGRTVPFVYPFTVDGMAEFRIFVQEKDAETARELLASMPEPAGEDGPEEPG